MARNSNNYNTPAGKRYKVNIEKGEEKDFMILYAEDAEDALIKAGIAWNGTKWKITNVTREYYIYNFGDTVDGNHIERVWLTEEEYKEMKDDDYAIFETYKEAYDYENDF